MAKNEYKPVGMLQVDENAVSNAVNQMVGNNNTIIKNLQDSLQKQQDYDLQKDIAEYNKYADERNFGENQRRFNENLAEKKLQGNRAYELGVRAQTENELNGATNRRIADSQNAISWKQIGLAQKAVDDAAKLEADTRLAYTTLFKLHAAEDALKNHAKQNNQLFDQKFLSDDNYFTDKSLKAARDLYIGRQKILAGLNPAALANVWALGSSNPQDQRFASGVLGQAFGNAVRGALTSLPIGSATATANAQSTAAANQNPVNNVVATLQNTELNEKVTNAIKTLTANAQSTAAANQNPVNNVVATLQNTELNEKVTNAIKTLNDLESSQDAYNSNGVALPPLQTILPLAHQKFNQQTPENVTWGFDNTKSNPLENGWVKWFLKYLKDNGLTSSWRIQEWIRSNPQALSFLAKTYQ